MVEKSKTNVVNKGAKKRNNSKNSSKSNKRNSNKNGSKSNKRKQKRIINRDNYLYLVFVLLLIIVIVLGILVFNASKKYKKTNGNIVISVNEKHDNSELDFDLVELSKKKDYTLKLTNYQQDSINKDKYNYSITITNNSDAKIYVWKDYKKKNLMVDQEATIIEGVSFDPSEKEFDIYHFSVINKEKVKKGDKIHLKISAQKV